MKVSFSSYLSGKKDLFKHLIDLLVKDFAYVSLLSTDCTGKRYEIQKQVTFVQESRWSEQGSVIRVPV